MESTKEFNWDAFWAVFMLVFCVGVLLLMTNINATQSAQLRIMERDDAALIKAAQKQMSVSDALLNNIPK
jgi:hypothetical protein